MVREIKFYKDFFIKFYLSLDDKTQEKVEYVFKLIRTVDVIPEKFLKRIKGTVGLFEIRIQQGNNIYRIFCCFDEWKLVVLYNGFVKKSRKTPKKEIDLAVKLMSQYFEEKNKWNEKDTWSNFIWWIA